jgi:hypothetical protein
MIRRLFLLSLLLLAVAGCASTQTSAPADRTRTRSDRLLHEEIVRTNLSNMYEVIQRLQPGWLRPQHDRGVPAPIAVFMDGARVGDVEFLRSIPASQVGEARFLNSREIGAQLTRSQQIGIGSAIMLTSVRM